MIGSEPYRPWWRQPFLLVLVGFLTVGGFFLVTEHAAHVLGVLPFVLLLACLPPVRAMARRRERNRTSERPSRASRSALETSQ